MLRRELTAVIKAVHELDKGTDLLDVRTQYGRWVFSGVDPEFSEVDCSKSGLKNKIIMVTNGVAGIILFPELASSIEYELEEARLVRQVLRTQLGSVLKTLEEIGVVMTPIGDYVDVIVPHFAFDIKGDYEGKSLVTIEGKRFVLAPKRF